MLSLYLLTVVGLVVVAACGPRAYRPAPESSALIISGPAGSVGNSVEVFVPSTGQHCQLPDLPGDLRYVHTMEEMTVCGGGWGNSSTYTSCLTMIDGTWQTTTTLLERR